ncbi:TIGR01777 family oxidoreductase [Granulicella sp. dw_53]|uniref:TIGR01777 family oxidoreductase n=1 Tax=Granulicella sp. dw_53 TaxID=2719792 RepID=UPI001BD5179C|nr:TIGR01777 family oxidoreductase [Granulicella sp. dw_53]
MRVVIPGGSGQVGQVLARHFHAKGDEVTVLSRRVAVAPWRVVVWDGRTAGDWVRELEGSDVCINLTGRSVNCRYTPENRREIFDSRVFSTRLLNEVIAGLERPPAVWLNSSTATIYRHALDRPMDEFTGELGGDEPGAPDTWNFSIDVAKGWEEAFFSTPTPRTRKVALRSAMTFSTDAGGVFDVFLGLVRRGLGGTNGKGTQYVSWIHETDFVRAIELLIADARFTGAVNLAAPNPLPNREFMRAMREAWGIGFGLPTAEWMIAIGTWAMRTESELVLKSRRVVPGRLLEAGFEFRYTEWPVAARELVERWRAGRAASAH